MTSWSGRDRFFQRHGPVTSARAGRANLLAVAYWSIHAFTVGCGIPRVRCEWDHGRPLKRSARNVVACVWAVRQAMGAGLGLGRIGGRREACGT